LSQEQLAKSLFPIGELTKPQVREIAAEMELVTAEKRFSRTMFYWKSSRNLQQKITTQRWFNCSD
jgi:tRNA U34 2-thiouridine synthase MnmA/TrmU